MEIFFEIGIAIVLAGILGFIAKILKQPLMLAFVLTGIILGPSLFNIVSNQEIIHYFSSMGIAFLLFIVGLDLNLKKIKGLSLYAISLGLSQVFFTFIFGFFISLFFDFSILASIYIALALTFSSTAIIVKLFSEKRELNSLHGKLIIGILIIQDVVALIALIVLRGLDVTNLTSVQIILPNLILTLIKGLGLFVFVFIAGKYIIPKILKIISQSVELLFLISISWCLGLALLAQYMGLSIEIGAFLAGISIATTPYSLDITSRIKPLRDFFITVFFISLGIQLFFNQILSNLFLVLIFSTFVIIINPVIMAIVMKMFGFRKRTSFLTSLTCAQISEFSLILVILGVSLGHIDSSIISLITSIAIVTITISSYLITYDNKIYSKLAKYLNILESKKRIFKELELDSKNLDNHIILFGGDRMGSSIIKTLKNLKEKFLVVDFNPEIIRQLKKKRIDATFGDAADPDIIEKTNLDKAKMIISTIPDFETNMTLLEKIKKIDRDILTYTMAENKNEALALYNFGADYVILPQALSGKYISILLKNTSFNKENLIPRKNLHIKELKA